jgi:hypothetical protein
MIIKEALPFLESGEMRGYLQNPEVKVTPWQWLDLIAKSRAGLADKAAALKEIAERYPTEPDKCFNPGVMAEQAFCALKETTLTPPGSVFILSVCWLDEDIEWNNDEFLGHYIKKDTTPFATFEQAVAYIKEEESDEAEGSDICIYYEIARWDLSESGELCESICWTLGSSDVIWGYRREEPIRRYGPLQDDNDFNFNYDSDLNLPLPLTYGDIITIDVRPFAEVFHGVIIWTNGGNYDCCSPTCLFINKKGKIESSALKHLFHCLPKFSPFLRMERYDGKLPEWEAPLKIISERVKEDNTLGDKLFYIEMEEKELTWAVIEPLIMGEG